MWPQICSAEWRPSSRPQVLVMTSSEGDAIAVAVEIMTMADADYEEPLLNSTGGTVPPVDVLRGVDGNAGEP